MVPTPDPNVHTTTAAMALMYGVMVLLLALPIIAFLVSNSIGHRQEMVVEKEITDDEQEGVK